MTEPTPISLVKKPTVEEEVKADVVQLLENALALAKEGQVDCVFIVTSNIDGTFSEAISKTLNFRSMIGQVEIVKQNWIWKYLSSLNGKPLPPGPRSSA